MVMIAKVAARYGDNVREIVLLPARVEPAAERSVLSEVRWGWWLRRVGMPNGFAACV